MPADWTPPPPPDVGSKQWLDDMAFALMCEEFNGLPDTSGVWELPNIIIGTVRYALGYFIVKRSPYGADYFRVDAIERFDVKPRVANVDQG